MADSTEVRTVDGRYYEVIQLGQSDLLYTNIRYAGIEILVAGWDTEKVNEVLKKVDAPFRVVDADNTNDTNNLQ